jgi:hypothetical protein
VVLAGEPVKASDIISPLVIKKAADEAVTSSSSMQNDDDFTYNFGVGVYRIELFAHVTGPTFKCQWASTATIAAAARAGVGPQSASTSATNTAMNTAGAGFSTSVQYGVASATATIIHEDLYVDVSASGSITLQWAQQTGNASPTTMLSQSRLYITQLESA